MIPKGSPLKRRVVRFEVVSTQRIITLVTMGQNVGFGIIACRRSVPKVQRLLDYMEDALVALEAAAGGTPRPKNPKVSSGLKSGTPKAKAKAKPK